MKFTLNRNKVVTSLFGHAVEFVKGEPTHVPPTMYQEVIAIGATPEEEIVEPEQTGPVAPVDPLAREQAVFEAFEALLLRNTREDFTAGGAPHAKAVSAVLGWPINSNERDTLWVKFRQKAE